MNGDGEVIIVVPSFYVVTFKLAKVSYADSLGTIHYLCRGGGWQE